MPNNICGNTQVEQNITPTDDATIHITKGVIIYDAVDIATKKSVSHQEKSAAKPIVENIYAAKETALKGNQRKSIVTKNVKSKVHFTSTSSTQQFGVYQNLNNSNSITHSNSFGKAFLSAQFSESIISGFIFLIRLYNAEFSRSAHLFSLHQFSTTTNSLELLKLLPFKSFYFEVNLESNLVRQTLNFTA